MQGTSQSNGRPRDVPSAPRSRRRPRERGRLARGGPSGRRSRRRLRALRRSGRRTRMRGRARPPASRCGRGSPLIAGQTCPVEISNPPAVVQDGGGSRFFGASENGGTAAVGWTVHDLAVEGVRDECRGARRRDAGAGAVAGDGLFPIALTEAVVLGGGLAAMLALDLVLLRRAFGPLGRLTAFMRGVDPLRPGERATVEAADPEVAELTGGVQRDARSAGARAARERAAGAGRAGGRAARGSRASSTTRSARR